MDNIWRFSKSLDIQKKELYSEIVILVKGEKGMNKQFDYGDLKTLPKYWVLYADADFTFIIKPYFMSENI